MMQKNILQAGNISLHSQKNNPAFFQPKLSINQPNDVYEQEADEVADKVMRMQDASPEKKFFSPPLFQRKCAHCEEEERKKLQRKEDSSDSLGAHAHAEAYIHNLKGGTPLNGEQKDFFESRMGYDFSDVRIHNDNSAHQSAKNINALAYTHGNNIVFGSGRYQPATGEGKRLMAHELTHVVQQKNNSIQPKTIQRKPASIQVPVPETVEDWKPPADVEFQWKNEALRKIIYPEREQSLRVFLELVKKFELKGYLTNPDTTSNDDMIAMLEADKKALEESSKQYADEKSNLQASVPVDEIELADLKKQRTQAQKDFSSLIKKGTETGDLYAARTKKQKDIQQQIKNADSAQENLDYLELKKNKLSQSDYEKKKKYYEDKRDAAITARQNIETELAPVNEQYEQLIAPQEQHVEAFKKDIPEKEKEIKEAKARIKALTKLISDASDDSKKIAQMISKVQSGKVKPGDKQSLTDWRLKKYRETISSMDHDQLLTDVVAAFERHASSGYFPSWLLYVVVQFSGMRYASAHGTWDKSPQSLLAELKDEEINTADDDTRKAFQGEAMQELSAKETKAVKGLWPGVKKRLSKADIPVFEKFEPLHELLIQDYIKLAGAEKGTDVYEDIIKSIGSTENSIAALQTEFSSKGWSLLVSKQKDETAMLIEIYRKNAKAKLMEISNPKALAMLKKMHSDGQIPDYAWKEITSFTELKFEIKDPADLVEKDQRGLKNVTVDADAEAIATLSKWKRILKAWHSSGTAWRAQNQETLSEAVMTSLVCDQIGSVAQHSRGIDFGKVNPYGGPGGLRNNAMFYYEISKGKDAPATSMPADKKSLCPTDPGQPFFKRPKKIEDFPCGASIFWTTWSDVGITKDYGKFYKEKEKPVLDKIRRLADERKKLLDKGDAKKELPKIEKELADINTERKKMLAERAGMAVFQEQTTKGFIPDLSNIVSAFPEKELQLFDSEIVYDETNAGGQDIATYKENSFEITDGLKRNGWTYSINDTRITRTVGKGDKAKQLSFGSVMRVKPNPNAGVCPDGEKSCPLNFDDKPDPKLIKQWLTWRHQATVAFVIPDENKVVTFDTSGSFGGTAIKGLTLRERSLSSMISESNLFVGYHPEEARDLSGYTDKDKILDKDAKPPASSSTPIIQPKLEINQPDDMYEQEADAMADHVMRMTDNDAFQPAFFRPPVTNVQRKCAHCEEEEKKVQRKESNNAPAEATLQTENYLRSLSPGRPLNKEEKSFFEPRIGYDFSGVRLHTDDAANRSAKSINALAYTHGNNIVFGADQYKPGSEGGKRLLAHELTHVVQQQNNSIQRKPAKDIKYERFPWIGRINAKYSAALRSSPAKDADDPHKNTIADLPYEDFVDVTGYEHGWLKVQATVNEKEVTGYVSRELVDFNRWDMEPEAIKTGLTMREAFVVLKRAETKRKTDKAYKPDDKEKEKIDAAIATVKGEPKYQVNETTYEIAFAAAGGNKIKVTTIQDFVLFVEAVEKQYPAASPKEVISEIRQLWFSDENWSVLVDSEGIRDNNVQIDIETAPNPIALMFDMKDLAPAAEGRILSTPMGDVNIGHVLAGIDARLSGAPAKFPKDHLSKAGMGAEFKYEKLKEFDNGDPTAFATFAGDLGQAFALYLYDRYDKNDKDARLWQYVNEYAKPEELLGDIHGYIAAQVAADIRAAGNSPTGSEIKASNIIRDMYLVDKSSVKTTYESYLEKVAKPSKDLKSYIYSESISFANLWYAKVAVENSGTIWLPGDLFEDAIRDFSEKFDRNERDADADDTLSGLTDKLINMANGKLR
ncbi:eCIS core domain-containing protein [Parafilimonas sp.]|uniref:eCIS core domain-containing protein n=1 Tax=Parafilimonas sp. TaxID=1969739 RepID=UPI003F7DF229